MDDKRKIVLGSEDIITKGLDDIFINVNLQKTFNQIKKDKYDNNFDLAEQFRKERNTSRSFRVYGIVDSTIIDTDNLSMNVYKDSGLTQLHSTITTTPLIYDEKNVFAKKRGKYLLELNNYDSDLVYIHITGDYLTYDDQTFEQRLVFYTLDGEFVEYGTETVDIGLDNPGFLQIENDFPFFYNKHWVKKDIEIIETKQAIVSFTEAESNTDEGSSTQITMALDKPSPFGNEVFDVDLQLLTAKVGDFNISMSGNPVSFPTTFSWVAGEQFKTFDFDGLNDDFPEFSESLLLGMSNFQLVQSGLTIVHTANIHDSTPRRYANYNFGEIYRNRYAFTGRTWENFNNNIVYSNSFSILRNGLYYERRNEEFYPNDTYTLRVINRGNDTILPVNTNLGIPQEELFLSGETRTFPLTVDYTGTQVERVKIILSGSGINAQNSNGGSVNINGTRFITNGVISYFNLKQFFTSQNPLILKSLEVPWDFEFNDTEKTIVITSKSPGVPVDLTIVESYGPGGTINPVNPNLSPIIEQIDEFVFYEQIPLEIQLAANSSSNSACFYEFFLEKEGFSSLQIIPTSIPAAPLSAVTDNFLITEVDFVMRDWDNNTQDCTFITGTTVATSAANSQTWTVAEVTPNQDNFIMTVDSAFINGSVLYSNNTLTAQNRPNESIYASAAFYPSKLQIEPCTDNPILLTSISQITKLSIPGIGSGNGTMAALLAANSNSFRSFDFRTGTTGAFTTFSKTNPTFLTFQDWKWNSNIQASGGSFAPSPNGQFSAILDYGNLPFFPVGPVEGQDSNGVHLAQNANDQIIYLKSKTPGVPFEIKNIVNAFVHTTASNVYNQQVVAGTILGPITTELIVPNAVGGIDPNPARNYLGGFNPVLQLVP